MSFSCFPFVSQWCTFSLKNWFHGASGLIFPHLTLVTQFPALKISWMAPGSLFSRTQHWLLSFPSIFNGNKSTHSWPRLSIGAQEEFLLNLVQTPFLEKLFFHSWFEFYILLVYDFLVVISALDDLKKYDSGAREATKFLEQEFKKGNRYWKRLISCVTSFCLNSSFSILWLNACNARILCTCSLDGLELKKRMKP